MFVWNVNIFYWCFVVILDYVYYIDNLLNMVLFVIILVFYYSFNII